MGRLPCDGNRPVEIIPMPEVGLEGGCTGLRAHDAGLAWLKVWKDAPPMFGIESKLDLI